MLVAALLGVGLLGVAAIGAWRFFGNGATATAPDASTPVAPGIGAALAAGEGTGAVAPGDVAAPVDAVASVEPAAPVDAVAPGEPAAPVDVRASSDAAAPQAGRAVPQRETPAAARAATTVAVLGSGDPAIVTPVVQAIEERAASAGWQLGEDAAGADRVIRVSFEQTGTQQLQFYGRSSEMVIGQLSVRAFGPAGGALGPGFRARVEYTALNADAKADEAVRGRLDGIVGAPGGG